MAAAYAVCSAARAGAAAHASATAIDPIKAATAACGRHHVPCKLLSLSRSPLPGKHVPSDGWFLNQGLEILLHDLGRRVDADLPDTALARVDELVRRVRRHDHDLARPGGDRLVADGEGRLALVHDEDLLVRMAVEVGALAGRVSAQEERHAGRAVLAALELLRALAAGKVV